MACEEGGGVRGVRIHGLSLRSRRFPRQKGRQSLVGHPEHWLRRRNTIKVCFLKLAVEMLKGGLEEMGGHIPTLILQLCIEFLFCARTVLALGILH